MKIRKNILCFFSIFTIIVSGFSGSVSGNTVEQYWPQGPEIQALAGIVMEADTGTILYEKNIHDVHYPASITKVLTTLLVLENSDMDEIVTFSEDAVFKTEGSGIARDVGEEMTMEQCLYAVMLESANECAYAVGEHVTGGDINAFVDMMNARAAELGCQNTHFANSSGLPDEQHYTTAYDMALIAREAYKNEDFRIICGTKQYTIPFTNKHTDEETYLRNHHQMFFPLKTSKYLYEYCTGGKTGYTIAANSTLVTYAEKDGVSLICVILNAPAGGHYEDTKGLFDFCFDNFKVMNVEENETTYVQENIREGGDFGSHKPFVDIDSTGSIILPVTAEFKDAKSEIVFENKSEDVLGQISYTYAGRYVGGADIVATNVSVEPFEFKQTAAEIAAENAKVEGEKKVVKINVRAILGVLGVLVIVLISGFLIWKFVDNFYYIKRKLNINRRQKSPYKTIHKNKLYKSRRKKWF